MKVCTVLGTRPEIIRLSVIIPKLDQAVEHTLVHTGQNFERSLSDEFFSSLGVRDPDRHLGVRAESAAGQIGQILVGVEQVFREVKPDRVLILGDTNSGLAAIVAKRMGISVFHMEAGNRCYDDRVPEEVNRRIIDHSTDVWMPYTERSRANLLREGIASQRIFVTGNPILEVIETYRPRIDASKVLETLELAERGYLLVTLHRAENVDGEERLIEILKGVRDLAAEIDVPAVISTHPRTRNRLATIQLDSSFDRLRFCDPFNLFDFVRLELGAACVLTDSGTVQEECCIFGIPNVTLRDVTERPETVECGSNLLAGGHAVDVVRAGKLALTHGRKWSAPPEYQRKAVSDTVIAITTGYFYGLEKPG